MQTDKQTDKQRNLCSFRMMKHGGCLGVWLLFLYLPLLQSLHSSVIFLAVVLSVLVGGLCVNGSCNLFILFVIIDFKRFTVKSIEMRSINHSKSLLS